jgi:hypothetical protein
LNVIEIGIGKDGQWGKNKRKMFDEIIVKTCNYYLYIGLQQNIKTPTNPSIEISFEIRAMWP